MRALVLIGVAGCATAASEPRSNDAPVVIELFTSQGCSSCPPADELLRNLARAGELGGRKLAPLMFHVDYWNDLGWPDPYSLPVWTQRQQAYARALGDTQVYTPELVVAGGAGMVGSQLAKVTQAIAAAPRQQPITATAAWDKASIKVTATAPAGADVFVAIWEDGTSTKVPRGENAGETLLGDRVVRTLERVAAAGAQGSVTIPIEGYRPGGAVAFAQRTDRRIVGATLLPR